jgi:hypothetical protein
VFEVNSNPGETYEPATDYIVDPASFYVGRTEKGCDRFMVGASRLARLSKLFADQTKPVFQAA